MLKKKYQIRSTVSVTIFQEVEETSKDKAYDLGVKGIYGSLKDIKISLPPGFTLEEQPTSAYIYKTDVKILD